jgi:hypothetical protein
MGKPIFVEFIFHKSDAPRQIGSFFAIETDMTDVRETRVDDWNGLADTCTQAGTGINDGVWDAVDILGDGGDMTGTEVEPRKGVVIVIGIGLQKANDGVGGNKCEMRVLVMHIII